MNTPILTTFGITIRDTDFADVEIPAARGLTLLETGRESHASSFSMVLSGRMKAKAGSIELAGQPAKTSTLAKNIALAGVSEIDSLERLVNVRTVVREQIAWASPWYRPTPRNIDTYEQWVSVAKHLSLNLDPSQAVGELSVVERFKLRVALSLVARPQAAALIVDDPDQVRSMTLRAEILESLKELSESVPVVVVSPNPDFDDIADFYLPITDSAASTRSIKEAN
ncbi:hypothetical protein [Corynebacterium callunae]|uniref:ABC transporter domain-containing protein n=1 Tax=Corynebacterium callunae DSM 20147 TaxID=1121353 RepID=M1TRX5_9CORY|nr:hypothetical protein [Corynebacterium callunae]AGG66996.1 hypothetical protein H924_07770 [Corynebacterium callunae DSM 20147]MCK2200304.1 hypothetical protein [Corynebacterium callunae]